MYIYNHINVNVYLHTHIYTSKFIYTYLSPTTLISGPVVLIRYGFSTTGSAISTRIRGLGIRNRGYAFFWSISC
jgi:hypothetical protein